MVGYSSRLRPRLRITTTMPNNFSAWLAASNVKDSLNRVTQDPKKELKEVL